MLCFPSAIFTDVQINALHSTFTCVSYLFVARTACNPRKSKPVAFRTSQGWSGCAMVLGKRPVPGRPIAIIVGQGPAALAVGAGGGGMDIFSLVYHFSLLSPSPQGGGPI